MLPLSSLTPHEDIYTVPNLLTFSRLIASPFIGYAILHDAHTWALGLFVYAGVSDLLDGWIARRWKLQTVVGSVVDPMADKILMTILTVCLAAKGALPGKLSSCLSCPIVPWCSQQNPGFMTPFSKTCSVHGSVYNYRLIPISCSTPIYRKNTHTDRILSCSLASLYHPWP